MYTQIGDFVHAMAGDMVDNTDFNSKHKEREPTWFEHMTDYEEAVALGLHKPPEPIVSVGDLRRITRIGDQVDKDDFNSKHREPTWFEHNETDYQEAARLGHVSDAGTPAPIVSVGESGFYIKH